MPIYSIQWKSHKGVTAIAKDLNAVDSYVSGLVNTKLCVEIKRQIMSLC